MLNKLRLNDGDKNTAYLLLARFIDKSDDIYPQTVLDLHPQNIITVLLNETVIRDRPTKITSINHGENLS